MTASAYHLFGDIYQRRQYLRSPQLAVENFMLRDDLISGRGSRGKFPDMVLRTNQHDLMFQGGEFIEIKDAKSGYTIPSFNSTIPSAYKNIRDHIGAAGTLYSQMKTNEDKDPYLLELREVYYLIRGCKNSDYKVCLVQGGFFETMSVIKNIKSALKDAFNDAMQDSNIENEMDAMRSVENVLSFDWKREHLAKVKRNKDASVSIRMRVMSEVINEANVLNAKQYPAIKDNTLNMIVVGHPELHYQQLEKDAISRMSIALGLNINCLPDDLTVSKLNHLRNGPFVLFQTVI